MSLFWKIVNPGKFDSLPEKLLAWRRSNPIKSDEAISKGREDFERQSDRDENLRRIPMITLGLLASTPDQRGQSDCEAMMERVVDEWPVKF